MKKTINAEVRKANKRGLEYNGMSVKTKRVRGMIEIQLLKGLERIGNKYAESEAEAIEIIANLWND